MGAAACLTTSSTKLQHSRVQRIEGGAERRPEIQFLSSILWMSLRAVPEGLFSRFSAPRCPKVTLLGSFLMTFRGSGAHVKTVLSRESQYDPEGSGGSENRLFFNVFF